MRKRCGDSINIIEISRKKYTIKENNKNNESYYNLEIKHNIKDITNDFVEKSINEHLFTKEEFFQISQIIKLYLCINLSPIDDVLFFKTIIFQNKLDINNETAIEDL